VYVAVEIFSLSHDSDTDIMPLETFPPQYFFFNFLSSITPVFWPCDISWKQPCLDSV